MKVLLVELLVVLVLSSALAAQKPANVLIGETNKDGYPPEVELKDRIEVSSEKQLARVESVDSAADMPVYIAVIIDKSGELSQLVNRETQY